MTIQKLHASDYDLSLAGYKSSCEHLYDELALLDLKLKRECLRKKYSSPGEAAESQSFFVSEEEILASLSPSSDGTEKGLLSSDIDFVERLIGEKEDEIALRCKAGEEGEEVLSLNKLCRIFGLTDFERAVIVTALAPDMDVKYERIYAYFNDDLNKRATSLHMALNLHTCHGESKLSNRQYFSKSSPLIRYRLIYFTNNHEEEGFLNRRVKVDEGIRAFLLGDAAIHPLLSDLVSLSFPFKTDALPKRAGGLKEAMEAALVRWMEGDSNGVVAWLYGEANDEKEGIRVLINSELNLPLLLADLEEIMQTADPVETVKLLCREAFMRSSLLHLVNGDCLCRSEGPIPLVREALLKSIPEYSWFVLVSAGNMWVPDKPGDRLLWLPVEVRLPVFEERRRIWEEVFQGDNVSASDLDVVAGRFTFSENRIRMVADYAKHLSGDKAISLDTLLKACSYQSTEKITKYTKKIKPHYSWDDLVLPADKLNHLKEICNLIKNKHTVYYKWGFDAKLALGRGVNMLFSGPSGTGKTMTADIMASELKLDLYKTDLSCLVSKYIGETEKNLSKIFSETSSGSAILFFDEADALFGKRSEVKDAHDRYANIEINYLLQKIEEHEGVVILSTNFSNNMDEAFLRRMHALVEFPFPDEKHRELIWRKIFPSEAPLSQEIDFQFLAQKINVAGGNIKNMALAGAFLAANEGSEIKMCHLINAVKREYQKMGKPFVSTDFSKYSEGDGK